MQATAAEDAELDEPLWGSGHARTGEQQFDLGSLLRGVMGNLAAAGNEPAAPGATGDARRSNDSNDPRQQQRQQGGGSNFRSGTTQYGPLSFHWGFGGTSTMQSSSSTTDRTGTNTTNRAGSNRQQPPTLSDFLRGSFPAEEERQEHTHDDDGMGGAGAAADGRFFNSDNPDRRRRSEGDDDARQQRPGNGHQQPDDLPPELASLREIFTNLFGGIGDGPAGMLVNMLGDNLMRGRSGDYVFGQQGLDDVISQLMEQTRGSTAPPAASDEAISRLEHFSRKDVKKVRQARNRECSTCMDSFEDEELPGQTDASIDSNRPPASAQAPSLEANDDPPELVPDGQEQQDELVMMPCRHLFHQDCLVPWLKTSGTCPVCRVQLDGSPTQGNIGDDAAATGSGNEATSSHVQMNDPVDDETPERRRERMRQAAEARAAHQTVPGGFVPPPADDLD